MTVLKRRASAAIIVARHLTAGTGENRIDRVDDGGAWVIGRQRRDRRPRRVDRHGLSLPRCQQDVLVIGGKYRRQKLLAAISADYRQKRDNETGGQVVKPIALDNGDERRRLPVSAWRPVNIVLRHRRGENS